MHNNLYLTSGQGHAMTEVCHEEYNQRLQLTSSFPVSLSMPLALFNRELLAKTAGDFVIPDDIFEGHRSKFAPES